MESQRQTTNPTVPETTAGATAASSTAAPASTETSNFGSNVNANELPPPPQRQPGTAPPVPSRADAATSRENPTGHHSGSNLINKAKGVVAQSHGLGENLRGNFNAAVDTAFNDKKGQERDEAIAGKGAQEVINKEFAHEKKPPKLA